MKLIFNIDFNTRPGQEVFVVTGGEKHHMIPCNNGRWTLSLDDFQDSEVVYRYEVMDNDTTLFETGFHRRMTIGKKSKVVKLYDSWQGLDENAPFLSAPFTDIFSHHKVKDLVTGRFKKEALIRVTAPNTDSDESIFVVGSCDVLGCWDVSKAVKMNYAGGGRWYAQLAFSDTFEYKFLRISSESVEWESGENHRFEMDDDLYKEGSCLREHSAAAFVPRKPRVAGTAIPVFALRSGNGFGIGDFSDIKLLVDWAVATGQKILQVLPINDTTSTGTWTDSYPYSGISIMALHPIYLNLHSLGKVGDSVKRSSFEKERKAVNALDRIDYERVLKLKDSYAREVFAQSGTEICNSAEFRAFYQKNRDWLLPYAAFCYLRDKNGTADFSKWGKYARYESEKIEKLWHSKGSGDEMRYWCYIQYYLDLQLRDARNYAHSKGVAIKGDIPIGVTPHSVEAWKEPYYFNMDSQAGAPPDFFSEDGQNWGFPTYNWDRMAQDGYLWWRRRFEKMAEYFDAYRIDHVLGFFRIWEIPQGFKSGLMGHFAPALPYSGDELLSKGFNLDLFLEDPHKPGWYHPRIDARGKGGPQMDALYDNFFYVRHNEFWKKEACKKLPALIAATNMLTCAEDLGMIPDCVPQVLDDLKVLTLEIQRMPKDIAVALGNPSSFPYMCVCTTGSHDTSTLRGWWGENHNGEDASPETCRWIIGEHLGAPAMLTILPWQDWTSIDVSVRAADTALERINEPANPKHYWRYRMHISLEDLMKMDDFNSRVLSMVHTSGR